MNSLPFSDNFIKNLSVSASIVSCDSAHLLPECVASLRENGVTEIVIVDNGCTDDTAAWAKGEGLGLVTCKLNEGYGRAMSQGVAATPPTDYCLLINPDLTMDAGAVAALLAAAQRYPDALLFGPQVIEPDGRIFFQARSLLSSFLPNKDGPLILPTGDASTPFLTGACHMVKRDWFLKTGGFDPNIYLYYEDDDLCRRAADAGQPPIYVPDAVTRHLRGQSHKVAPAKRYAYIEKGRWHAAWSRFYISQKYNLPISPQRWMNWFAFKWLGAAVIFNRAKRARYAGSYLGARAFSRGETALQKENLS